MKFRNIADSLVSFPTQWHLRRDSRSIEELTKEAEAKLQMLLYTNGKTLGIVEKGNLEAGKSAEDIGSWSSSIEEPIAETDKEVSRLEKWLVETNEEIEHRKQKDEEEKKARAREELRSSNSKESKWR